MLQKTVTVGSEELIYAEDAAVFGLWSEEINMEADMLNFVKTELIDEDGDIADCWPEIPELPAELPSDALADSWSDAFAESDGGGDSEEKSGCQSPVMEPPQDPVWELQTETVVLGGTDILPSSDPDARPEDCRTTDVVKYLGHVFKTWELVELQPPEDGGVRNIERLCCHKIEIEKERGKQHPSEDD